VLDALRQSVNRGCPFGEDDWQKQVVADLGLEATMRPRGRPRKTADEKNEEEDSNDRNNDP
jgi:putative transposase